MITSYVPSQIQKKGHKCDKNIDKEIAGASARGRLADDTAEQSVLILISHLFRSAFCALEKHGVRGLRTKINPIIKETCDSAQ